VSVEVVAQLPRGDEDYIKQLMDLQVPCLGLVDFADAVHQSLDGSDPPRGGSGASISIGVGSGSSRSSGSGGTSEVRDPMTVWS
jgi:hypothetical protein